MDNNKMNSADNIVFHYYPFTECIAKVAVNMKTGKKIVFRFALKDLNSAETWLKRTDFYKLPYKIIVHYAE